MCPPAALALVSTAASVGGTVMGFMGQQANARAQMAHNALVDRQNTQHFKEVLKWQTEQYREDTAHAWRMFEFTKQEWDRQEQFLNRAGEQIEQNLINKFGANLLQQIEQNMASAFSAEDISRQGRRARAEAQVMADMRGVEGNSVDAILQNINFQEGEATTMVDLNRSATQRQLVLEAMGLKAEADANFLNLPMKTFAPQQAVAPPQPVSPVAPQAPVPQPNAGAMIANVVGGVAQGFVNYANWSGQSVAQAFRIGG